MPISIRAQDTRGLIGVINELYVPSTFLLDRFFPGVITFDTEFVHFDQITEGRKLAAFVHPDQPANRNSDRGYETTSIKAPYIKEDEPIKPGKSLVRRAGEDWGGDMSPEERFDALILDALDRQRKKILRRKEWMASTLLRTATMSLTGVGYDNPITVSFPRAASLSVTLAPGDQWGDEGVSIIDSLEDWAGAVQEECGVAPTEVVMDPKAWKLARKDPEFLEALDNRRGGTSTADLGPVNPDDVSHARYVGHVGDLDIWIYQQTYEDDAGGRQQFLPDYTVLMGSAAIEGVRCYGAIQSVDEMLPVEMAPRQYPERNPDAWIAETQSAPVPVLQRPNASFRATVK